MLSLSADKLSNTDTYSPVFEVLSKPAVTLSESDLANFIKGTVKGMQGKDCVVTIEGRDVTVETDTPRDAGAEGEIVLRPEAIRIAPEGLLPCTVELSCFMGSYQNYHVRLEDGTLVKITDSCPLNKRVFEVGERAAISFDKDCAHLL